MAIIAVAGRKGGVGKSTIVGNLAGEFARMGLSVAMLDADPQHSLATWAEQGDGMLSRCVEKVADGAATLDPLHPAWDIAVEVASAARLSPYN